jgi:hypothetical protein
LRAFAAGRERQGFLGLWAFWRLGQFFGGSQNRARHVKCAGCRPLAFWGRYMKDKVREKAKNKKQDKVKGKAQDKVKGKAEAEGKVKGKAEAEGTVNDDVKREVRAAVEEMALEVQKLYTDNQNAIQKKAKSAAGITMEETEERMERQNKKVASLEQKCGKRCFKPLRDRQKSDA